MSNTIQLKQKTFILCTAMIDLAVRVYFLLGYLIGENSLSFSSLLIHILNISTGIVWLSYVFQYQKQRNILLILTLTLFGFRVIFEHWLNWQGHSLLGLIQLLVLVLMYILAIIDSIHGLKRKTFVIIAISCPLLPEVTFLKYIYYGYIRFEHWTGMISLIVSYIGLISFILSILVFTIKNRVFPLRKVKSKKRTKALAKLSPEVALKQLKTDFEYGYITEEEYATERTRIISEL